MNRRVSTRWLIVAPTWLLMSSPMTGRPALREATLPVRLAADEDRDGVDEPDAGGERLLGVPLRRLLAADRQVGDHDVDLALLEDPDDVGRRAGRLLDDLAEVFAQAVVGHPALDGDARVAGPAGRRRCCSASCRSPRTGPCRPCSCRCRRRRRTRCRGRDSRRGRRASAPGRSRPSWRSRSSSDPGRGCSRSCRRRRSRRGSCRRRAVRRLPRCCVGVAPFLPLLPFLLTSFSVAPLLGLVGGLAIWLGGGRAGSAG